MPAKQDKGHSELLWNHVSGSLVPPSAMTQPMDGPGRGKGLRDALIFAGLFAGIKLLLQFALTLWTTHLGYSYFRDEFYYIACGRHLAWGYVDHGPLVALQARLGELLFGDSVFALRVLSAFAGAVMIFLCGMVAWAFGGRRSAQALAMLGLLCCPQFIGTDGFLSMNSWEPIFWTLCLLAVVLLLRGGSARLWWTVFGLAAGIGLLNKPSMLFFLIALGTGLLLTPERRVLFTRSAAWGLLLLVLLVMPNVLWQVHHHWPTLDFLENGKRLGKNVVVPLAPFLLTQILDLHPINTLIWIPGVVALLRGRSISRARWLGIAYLFFLALMFALHAKDYYLAAIYPALFAAGGVTWQHRYAESARVQGEQVVAFPVFTAVLLATSLVILPMASPVLRPEAWVRYTRTLKLFHPEQESFGTAILPQFYADRFGWQQELDLVSAAYQSLPHVTGPASACLPATMAKPAPSSSSHPCRTSPCRPLSPGRTTTGYGVRGAARVSSCLPSSVTAPRTCP